MLRSFYALQRELGKGDSPNLIAASVLISITSFFYLLNLVSFFQPIVYPFIDRISYPSYFEEKYFVSSVVDSIVIISCTLLWFQFSIVNKRKFFLMAAFALTFFLFFYFSIEFATMIVVLISLPIILLFIIFSKISNKLFLYFDFKLTINYVSILGISIAVFGAVMIISRILFPESTLEQLNYQYSFFLILSIFSPLYLLLLPFSYPLATVFRILNKKRKKSTTPECEKINLKEIHVRLSSRFFHLSLLILLAVTVAMIPHLSSVNKDGMVIGTDTKYYIRFLETMADSSGYDEVIYKAFVIVVTGDRPISMLFFFWLASTFYQDNYYFLLEDLPFILGPMLVLSIYFLTLGITRNHLISIIASLLTIPSHILIGIYAGLYANWFSLIWGYLAIAFMFKLLEQPKKSYILIFSILLIMVILSHAPTWSIFIYAIGIFLVVIFIKKSDNRKAVFYTFICILPSVFIDIARMMLVNSSGVKQEISFALEREVGFHSIQTIWNNLVDTSYLYWAGQIANPIILLLVICWLCGTKARANYVVFFIVFFLLFALALFFADETIQSRFLYEIPLQVPAAFAIVALKKRIGSFMPVAICFWLIVMSLYMATNFVLVVPDKYL
jgi:hypothetical protein